MYNITVFSYSFKKINVKILEILKLLEMVDIFSDGIIHIIEN